MNMSERRECARKRERTAAVSTPVGPPPQTTKLSSRLRSSSVVDGSEEISKLSAIRTDERVGFVEVEKGIT
jgi:hypothetical protein